MVCKPNLVKPFAQGFSFGLVPGPSLSICHCTKITITSHSLTLFISHSYPALILQVCKSISSVMEILEKLWIYFNLASFAYKILQFHLDTTI